MTQLTNILHDEILSDIDRIRDDETLYVEKYFYLRQQAIDYIGFHIIDRIDVFMESTGVVDQIRSLKQYAEQVKCHLEEIDAEMFHQLRTGISQGRYKGQLLIDLIDEYLGNNLSAILREETIGYDDLDMFLNGLLTSQNLPAETIEREPEMVYYQKTPARIIMELVKKAEFKPDDIFFDLGSGLGQVVILVNLLTSVVSKGVEFEPAFCSYARACATDLNLNNIDFIDADARYADFSSGTIFFMYTPFEGKMLQDVLQNLHGEAKKRKIKVFTYGPCTREVAKQSWLIKKHEGQNAISSLVEFFSA